MNSRGPRPSALAIFDRSPSQSITKRDPRNSTASRERQLHALENCRFVVGECSVGETAEIDSRYRSRDGRIAGFAHEGRVIEGATRLVDGGADWSGPVDQVV